jgi:hypothetical protein
MMFVRHRKDTYGPTRPVTVIGFLVSKASLWMHMWSVSQRCKSAPITGDNIPTSCDGMSRYEVDLRYTDCTRRDANFVVSPGEICLYPCNRIDVLCCVTRTHIVMAADIALHLAASADVHIFG